MIGVEEPFQREITPVLSARLEESRLETGWPVCRMPRVDHADLQFDGADYQLRMDNEQNYSLADAQGRTCVQIMHRGMVGGWKVWTWRSMPAAFLCGLFVFCRYLEKENEFIVV